MIFCPVIRRRHAEIQARALVPFLAVTAFPTQIGKVVECYRWVCVANPSTLIAAGADKNNLHKGLGFVVPLSVCGMDNLAVVTPGIGERIFIAHVVAIESESMGFAIQMFTEERLICLAMSFAGDFTRHSLTPETRAQTGFPSAVDRAASH